MDEKREPMERRSQRHLKAMDAATGRYFRRLQAGDKRGAEKQLEISASHFAALYKDAPAAFHEGVGPSDAQVDEIRNLIEHSDPITMQPYQPLFLEGVLATIFAIAVPDTDGADCTFWVMCRDPTLEDPGPLDQINLATLPIYLEGDTDVLGSSRRAKLIFRGIQAGSTLKLRFGEDAHMPVPQP